VTRSALRILERARASAWRRVGIPAQWPDAEDAVKPAADPSGKNVAADPSEDVGTGRSEDGPKPVTDDSASS
jgi:hypothetical protein